jgi:Fe-S-cluster containining protein
MQAESESAGRVGRLALRLGGERHEIEAEVPEGPARLSDMLPAIRAITEAVVKASVDAASQAGGSVSCRAGCGACCRQPVPIAECEAQALRRLVAEMPEARRRTIEARFAEAAERLRARGQLDRMLAMPKVVDRDERQALGLEYFRLGIACPFLEEESCSIHPDRPLACREYLVTSPAGRCAEPEAGRIEMVPVPVSTAGTLARLGDDGGWAGPRMQLMIAALGHAGPEPSGEVESAHTGAELLEVFVRGLAEAPC